MSGADGNPIVPVDVVQGIVQQLATVSQHTTTATTAMRHLVSEIACLQDLTQRVRRRWWRCWLERVCEVGARE